MSREVIVFLCYNLITDDSFLLLQIKNQYMSTVSELTAEINGLQDELRRTKSELSISQIQVKELRATLEELRLQLMKQVGDIIVSIPDCPFLALPPLPHSSPPLLSPTLHPHTRNLICCIYLFFNCFKTK